MRFWVHAFALLRFLNFCALFLRSLIFRARTFVLVILCSIYGQERTARTGQAEQNCYDRTAVTGLAEQNRTGLAEQDRTDRTGQVQ